MRWPSAETSRVTDYLLTPDNSGRNVLRPGVNGLESPNPAGVTHGLTRDPDGAIDDPFVSGS